MITERGLLYRPLDIHIAACRRACDFRSWFDKLTMNVFLGCITRVWNLFDP